MKIDNTPAFPLIAHRKENHMGYEDHDKQEGMTIRDYFAIHAPTEEISIMGFSYESGRYLPCVVKARYRYADAMLAERLKNE